MTEPITFRSTTPKYQLPMLFSGQVQKEFFVNHAHLLLDTLVHTATKGVASVPPAAPVEGDTWLIDVAANEAWTGKDGHLAVWAGSEWLFISPRKGMSVYDEGAGHFFVFDSNWESASAPTAPVGGTTIDTEARQALETLVQSLQKIGIIASS
jgi:hypothetical protein